MPVSIRRRMVVAAFVGGLSAGAGTTAAAAAPAPVTVAVAPVPNPSPGYRIELSNDTGFPVYTTVRQELPPGTTPNAISDGGRTVPTGGRSTVGATPAAGAAGAAASEVTWRVRVAPRTTMTLTTALSAAPGATGLAAPACAFALGQELPYDCASATWNAPVVRRAGPPWWRQPAFIGGVLGALVLLAAVGWIWLLVRRRRHKLRRAESRQRSGVAVYDPQAARGTLYPRPSAPRMAPRRGRPPVWLVVGAATAVLAGVVLAVVWTGTSRVAAIRADRQPTSGAWVGTGAVGAVGASLRETAFEFTVYRLACAPSGTAPSRCQATVGLRNLTPQDQPWYGPLQRAYQPGGSWVPADEAATRTANGGRDLFAEPVRANQRLLVPLVFTMSGREPPTQLELRSAVFSAGVRVTL